MTSNIVDGIENYSGSYTIYSPDGTAVYITAWNAADPQFAIDQFGVTDQYGRYIATEDTNGNYLSADPGLNLYYDEYNNLPLSGGFYDTLGRMIVFVDAGAPCDSKTLYCYYVLNAAGGVGIYKAATSQISMKTNFGFPGVAECSSNCTMYVIQTLTLPDDSTYTFKYDCDSTTRNPACGSPGGQSAYYGQLISMTLPTGGVVNYSHTIFTDAYGGKTSWLNSRTANGSTWTYTPTVLSNCSPTQVGCQQQTTVTRPTGDTTNYIFTLNNGAWATSIVSKDSSGNTLSTTGKTWDFSTNYPIPYNYGAAYIKLLAETTSFPMPGGTQVAKQTKYAYDSNQNGNVQSVQEWGYYPGAFPTTPDRATYTTYLTTATHDINRPTSVTVCGKGTGSSCSGGTLVAQTKITYDGYGSNGSSPLKLVTGAPNHDDTDFGISYTTRGNATQISKWVSGQTFLTTAIPSYDTTGQVVKVLDSNNHPTTYSYSDTNHFYIDSGSDPPATYTTAAPTNAYVTSVTDAIGTRSTGYYYWTGQIATVTDYNQETTYRHYVDPFNRPTATDYPIGWTLNQYQVPSQGQTEIDSYVAVGDTAATGSTSCTLCTHTQALLDGLGRTVTGNLVNNPAGEVTVTSVYDSLNRVISSSHPHMGTGDPNNVSETMYYDGLGRAIATRHPDGQVARSAYGAKVASLGGLISQQSFGATYGYGFPVISVDEAGKQKQEWIDGFGRVIEVDEPSTNTGVLATATITISGSAAGNSGSITVTVNGFAATAYWCASSTAASVAASLGVALGSALSPVAATVNGTAVTMTAVGFAPSFSVSYTAADFIATPASGTFTGGTGGITSSPSVTMYTYDVLGNLTGVTQGAQTRSWRYDGLSRLTQEITPEAGTVNLSYVAASGGLCSGNPSNPCSRTAPAPNQTGSATITTTYTYNAANQLTQKTHSDTTGTESYCYGTSCGGGSGTAFMIGRLATMTDPSGSEAYTYDQIGRVTKVVKTIGSTNYTTQYTYNSGDQLTSVTYPSGRVVDYNYDNVGHLCQVATTSSNCNSAIAYLTLPSGSYDAAGRPLSATYGNGVVATAAYAPLTSELTSIRYAKGSTPLFGLVYYYQQQSTKCPTGNPIGNNGQIQCIFDFVQPSRSSTYTYDQLGRLSTANTAGGGTYAAWGVAETYDRYGNRSAQSVTVGSAPAPSFTINPVNNQITSFTYDAAGNVISEPSPLSASYTYDGEECNTGFVGNGNSATYLCDGNHLRVEKVVTGSSTTVSVRSGGQVIAEYDNGAAVTSPTREYLYGNNLLAIVTGSTGGSGGTIIYQHRDHLSPRLYTDVNGNCVGDQGTYPFGELWYSNNDPNCTNTTSTPWVFTSYERDQESGNDYALARSYASGQGRFLAPDPLEGVVGDPQSWNRYAYVENDPINLDDPSGQGFWSSLFGDIFSLFVNLVTGDLINLAYGGNLNPTSLPSGCSNITCTGPPIFSQNGSQNGGQDLTAQSTQQPGPIITVPVGGGPGPGPTAPGNAGNASPGTPNQKPQYQYPQNEEEAEITNIVFNEGSSLHPNPEGGSAEDLADAREGMAEVAIRLRRSRHFNPKQLAPPDLTNESRVALAAGNADAIQAHNDSLAAARIALAGANNTSGDTQYRLRPPWVNSELPINKKAINFSYGPFRNTFGPPRTIVFAP